MAVGPVLALLLLLLPANGGLEPAGTGTGTDAPIKAPAPDVTTPWDNEYQEHCVAPPQTGPCRAAFQRWFYSPESRQCRTFIYGGCRGNRNNYSNREECLQRCNGGDSNSSWHLTAALLALLLLLALLVLVVLVLTRCGATTRYWQLRRSSADKEKLMSSAEA